MPFWLWTQVGPRTHVLWYICATWRIRLNHPPAAVMQPFDHLLLFGHIATLARCGLLLQMKYRGLSVSLSWPWTLQNGWIDPDAIWDVHSDGPKEPHRWGPDPHMRTGHWGWKGAGPGHTQAVNTIEPSMCGSYAALCQVTLTTSCCWWWWWCCAGIKLWYSV